MTYETKLPNCNLKRTHKDLAENQPMIQVKRTKIWMHFNACKICWENCKHNMHRGVQKAFGLSSWSKYNSKFPLEQIFHFFSLLFGVSPAVVEQQHWYPQLADAVFTKYILMSPTNDFMRQNASLAQKAHTPSVPKCIILSKMILHFGTKEVIYSMSVLTE